MIKDITNFKNWVKFLLLLNAWFIEALVMFCVRTIFVASVSALFLTTMIPDYAYSQSEWEGAWIGGGIGYKWLDTEFQGSSEDLGVAPAIGPVAEIQLTPGTPVARTGAFSADGPTLGILTGYNFRNGSLIFGFEGDFDLTDVSQSEIVNASSITDYNGANTDDIDFGIRRDSCLTSKHMNSEASLRGRIGYLVSPEILLFVTGGVSAAYVEHDINCQTSIDFFDPNTTAFLGTHTTSVRDSDKGWEFGWTVGGGGEVLLPNGWNARIDYAYVDLKSTDQTVNIERSSTFAGFANTGTRSTNYEWDEDYHKVRLSLVYRFSLPQHIPLK